jgi:phage gpG-like protein
MSMFKITSNSKQYLAALAKVPKAMEKVTARTLSETARRARADAEANLKKEMIVRTQYTLRSVRFFKASESKPIARQNAVMGTVSDYLPVHDKGGVIRARKRKIAVPTNKIRGKDRKKKIPARYKLSTGKPAFRLNPARPARALARAALFVREGRGLVKLYDIEGRSYRVKGNRWHSSAVAKHGNYPAMAAVFKTEAERALAELARQAGR